MTSATTGAKPLFTTARVTGLFYLGLVLCGVIGYVMPLSRLYVPGDAAATLARLVENERVARVGLIGQLGIGAFGVLVALWFFRLWRRVSSFAAGALAAFQLLGAAFALVGLVFSWAALRVALGPASAPGGDQAATALLMWELFDGTWTVATLFCGLWLIPMGYLVLAVRMPRLLGWILIVGGVGYIFSGIVIIAAPAAPAALTAVGPGLATVGELWIVGYLLSSRAGAQVRRHPEGTDPRPGLADLPGPAASRDAARLMHGERRGGE